MAPTMRPNETDWDSLPSEGERKEIAAWLNVGLLVSNEAVTTLFELFGLYKVEVEAEVDWDP